MYFEAYLDDFQKIIIYLSKASYNGDSRCFYLRDRLGNSYPLQIVSIEPESGYNMYTCLSTKPIDIGEEYEVVHQYARSTVLQYGYVVKRKAFDEMFAYESDDLGAVYTPKATTFKLWAPTAAKVCVEITHQGKTKLYYMERQDKGVFALVLEGNYENAVYVYHVRVNGQWNETVDPYGKSSTVNGLRSVVVDVKRFKYRNYDMKPLKSYTDAIIYEASVRDLTMQPNIGVRHAGKFKGFVEENETTKFLNTGFSYLKSLGVTHIQLMPVLDFGSVDEFNQRLFYNWGYDATQYFTLEGSYASDVTDPLSRLGDFMQMVDRLHEAGLRVILDVVFNHVFDMENSAFQKCVPNYYFQMNESGNFSNGTWCGNDFDSRTAMGKKFVVDACRYWVENFGVDGFRFDLMGILDIDTLNEVDRVCRAINPSLMIVGEGWDMPSYLAPELRASLRNCQAMPNIAHFSDRFRDVVKGRTNVSEVDIKGYCSGDFNLIDIMKNVLTASVTHEGDTPYFYEVTQALNYVECHDNMTCWDKLRDCCKEDTREKRIKRHEMCIAATMFAQGIPFLHCGQEFARTKLGKPNTYCDSDSINRIDYDRRNRYMGVVEYTRDCIKLRKRLACMRYRTKQEVIDHVSFSDINRTALVYRMKDEEHDVIVIFNPSDKNFEFDCNKRYELLFYNGLVENEFYQYVKINPLSVLVLRYRG